MTAPVFVDTNVLVYARDQTDARKHGCARTWMAHLWQTRAGRTSFQVLHEYYTVVTRKLQPRLAPDEARLDVRDLLTWQPQWSDGDVLESAWAVQDRYGLSFWDALIVASAQTSGCRYLLTEDLQHGQDLDGTTVLSPFEAEPADAV